MIFVTVGTQLPFDRLIRGIDDWARARGRRDIFAQIGSTPYRPIYIDWQPHITPAEYQVRASQAELIVSHAGMGSILTAQETGKPIIIMPRRATLGEHRNDHQLATAKRFEGQDGVTVVYTEEQLECELDRMRDIVDSAPMRSSASPSLLATLRQFIQGGLKGDVPGVEPVLSRESERVAS